MKVLHFLSLLFILTLSLSSCKKDEITTAIDTSPQEPPERITDRCGGFYVHQHIMFKGRDFSEICSDHSISLARITGEIPLEIIDCSSEHITGFIPYDIEPGDYWINLVIDNEPYMPTEETRGFFDVRVRRRPVILELSETTCSYGDTIVATGFFFIDPEAGPEDYPKTQISGGNFIHYDVPTEFNEEGTEAIIAINTSLPPEEYRLRIVNGNLGNEVRIDIE